MRRGVIDIGTNSVKLLVADVSDANILPVRETSRQTRLGRGLYDGGKLQPGPIQATVAAISELRDLAKMDDCRDTRIIATSAVREAANASELLDALAQSTVVLSGDDEARLAYDGVLSCPRLANRPTLVVDVGGGSTEFIVGDADGMRHHASLPLGSVRLMEGHPVSDPPAIDELKTILQSIDGNLGEPTLPGLRAHLDVLGGLPTFVMIGSGGMAGILANMELGANDYDRERMEAVELPLNCVTVWRERLWGMPLDRRREITGLPSNRADVALYGSLIYEQIMRQLGLVVLRVSTRGIRFGFLRS